MKYFITTVVLVLIVVVCAIQMTGHLRHGKCVFLSVDEAVGFLTGDSDGYHRRFHKEDLYARKVATVDEYSKRIRNSGCIGTFTADEMRRIREACRVADEFIHSYSEPWFDGDKCSRMTWNIVCVDGSEYENGLPHTRGHMIFFPRRYLYIKNPTRYTRTLVHEKVHVYQKTFSHDTRTYLTAHGFEVVGHRRDNLVRANSDTDDFVYRVYGTGETLFAKYKSRTPESIEDIFYADNSTQRNEHPFERMAVDIASRFQAAS